MAASPYGRDAALRRQASQHGRGVVGSWLNPHTPGDIEEGVASLHTEMMQFGHDLADQIFLQDPSHLGFDTPRPGIPPEKVRLYQEVWRPLMNEWLRFQETHADSFWQNLPFSGAWDRLQDFRQRLLDVRNRAKATQFEIRTPEPLPPSRDPDPLTTTKDTIEIGAAIVGGAIFLALLVRGKG